MCGHENFCVIRRRRFLFACCPMCPVLAKEKLRTFEHSKSIPAEKWANALTPQPSTLPDYRVKQNRSSQYFTLSQRDVSRGETERSSDYVTMVGECVVRSTNHRKTCPCKLAPSDGAD
ncbi:hypothetical protein RRG08_032765 [Elysia crispata]|uniref:Uncharacterized protein n=1 Tax=Elysia crispata TaxID=231223 RepID=A0AAE0YNJ9_9GAST|nr:hypothetical protein RRG08_032765 [Elysia crispata]